jgi:hypothetical protein
MFGQVRRGSRQVAVAASCLGGRVKYPQQSTAFVGTSQISWNLHEIVGVPYFDSATERVSCICQLVISRTACPSGSPSEPLTCSRDAAGNMAICACTRVFWSCRAVNASILPAIPAAISPVRRHPGLAAVGLSAMELPMGRRPPPERKKLWSRPEPAASPAVNGQMPGEAPQPLTLNHPASNPGRFSGRGSSFPKCPGPIPGRPPDCRGEPSRLGRKSRGSYRYPRTSGL